MNILLVSAGSDVTNGAAKSLLNMARYFTRNHIQTVVLLPTRGPIEAELQSMGIAYHVVRHLSRWTIPISLEYPKGFVQTVKRFMRIRYDRYIASALIQRVMEAHKIDIVHINASTTCDGAVAAIRKKKKLVWHIREFMEEDLRKNFVDAQSANQLMSRSDCVIAISDAIRQKYLDRIDTRILRIYNGVDAGRFYEPRRVLDSDTVKILISGRVTPKKGQLTLLKALRIVKQAGFHHFECHILGYLENRPYVNELTEFIQANGMDQCVFLDGYTANIAQWLKQSDILCMCSAKEAFGLSTIEGMLSGCLVVGADTGATPEIIQNDATGLIYAYGEDGGSETLAERLIWVLKNAEEAARIAARGQAYALEQFDSDVTYRQIVKLYEELMKKP